MHENQYACFHAAEKKQTLLRLYQEALIEGAADSWLCFLLAPFAVNRLGFFATNYESDELLFVQFV